MFVGRLHKEGKWWAAECEAIGAFTQGRTRKEAEANLVEVVELKVDRPKFKATLVDLGGGEVLVDGNESARLLAEVLKYQRERHQLSLADVAKRLGEKSRNGYAAYEQGKREPSISRLRQLLAVVAPEMALTVGPRDR